MEALAHEDVNIRRATFDELANTTGETFGYRHDASTTERAQAVEAWKTWLTHAESDSRPKAST